MAASRSVKRQSDTGRLARTLLQSGIDKEHIAEEAAWDFLNAIREVFPEILGELLPSKNDGQVSDDWLGVRDDFRNWLIREAA